MFIFPFPWPLYHIWGQISGSCATQQLCEFHMKGSLFLPEVNKLIVSRKNHPYFGSVFAVCEISEVEEQAVGRGGPKI